MFSHVPTVLIFPVILLPVIYLYAGISFSALLLATKTRTLCLLILLDTFLAFGKSSPLISWAAYEAVCVLVRHKKGFLALQINAICEARYHRD